MLTVETLKKNYIDIVLKNTKLPFFIYTDTGNYKKAVRDYNTVTDYINGLFTVSGSSVEYAGNQEITSLSTELKFLVRLGDEPTANGVFQNAQEFREALSQAFSSVPPRFNVEEKGETYTVVVGYSFPSTGTREQKTGAGDSLTYSCSVYFAYLKAALNASDVEITIDGEKVYPLAIGVARRPSLVANLFSENVNGESAVYAENAGFVIDLTMPAFIGATSGMIADYIFGLEEANTPHTVVLNYGEKAVTKMMIFGESSGQGQGIENVRYTVSLVPYASEATTEG